MDKKDCAVIGWDHPMVAAGWLPGELLESEFGFSASYFKLWARDQVKAGRGKIINGKFFFSADAMQRWLGEPEH
jgi:hypothetical protein